MWKDQLVVSFIIGTFFLFQSSFTNITVALEEISEKDQKILSEFFRDMLSQGDFAEVLLGDKPASVHDCVWWVNKSKKQRPKDFVFLCYQGFKAWKKYEHLFPNKQFFLFCEEKEDGTFSVWFVKRNTKKKIDEFLESQKQGVDLHEAFGTLLGYPEEDVDAFCLLIKILSTLAYFPYDTKSYEAPSSKLSDLISNPHIDPVLALEELEAQYSFHPVCSKNDLFFPVAMHGCYSATHKDKIDTQWRENVVKLYNSDNFLEEFLLLIAQK